MPTKEGLMDEPLKVQIGKRIRELRTKNGWSMDALAEKIDVKRQTVSNYESGKTQPSSRTLDGLASAFGVSTDYLLGISSERGSYIPSPTLPVCTNAEEIHHQSDARNRFIAPQEAVELHPNSVYIEVPDNRINRKVPRGYIAMVDVGIDRPKRGAIHCVSVDGELVFGVINELTDGFELSPTSWDPTARPVVVDNGNPSVEIIGIVVRATMPDWYEL